MPKCQWRERPSDKPTCTTLADDGKQLCPRHEFLQQLREQKRDGREKAKAHRAYGMPKTRKALLAEGYHFTGEGNCSGCNQRIEWWKTKLNRPMPFNRMPHEDSTAVTHFISCTRANDFRRSA